MFEAKDACSLFGTEYCAQILVPLEVNVNKTDVRVKIRWKKLSKKPRINLPNFQFSDTRSNRKMIANVSKEKLGYGQKTICQDYASNRDFVQSQFQAIFKARGSPMETKRHSFHTVLSHFFSIRASKIIILYGGELWKFGDEWRTVRGKIVFPQHFFP